jgi:hypothetical protein
MWVEDLEEKDPFYFVSTENGWTNDVYRMEWLKTVFKPYIRLKRAITKRLLIVNGYLSYVNLVFIEYVSCYNIIILIFSSYSTYRLQPFDLNCFFPLSIKYGVHLNVWCYKLLGQICIIKRTFLLIFRLA